MSKLPNYCNCLFFIFRLVWEVEGWFEAGLDINVCPIPVKTDIGQVDLVLRLSDGTSEKIRDS